LIWLKRAAPVILIVLLWGGYVFWRGYSEQRREREEDRLATVTARVWIASAEYRHDPDRFIQYRDSLLAASGIKKKRLFSFLKWYQGEQEEYLPFTRKVKTLVDSLVAVENARLKEQADSTADSAIVR